MIVLKKIGVYEVTLMKDIFGRYLCRFWHNLIYREFLSKINLLLIEKHLSKLKKLI